ncbi:hypothetical protein [Actinoplanes sp. DH11]|uniref:hypothetical protein n=1 Tax=Actinoplanes sp. DH11 TaxID=2857011 RepID=UPI001E29D44D|nr:hypothetical protein [Actinoplanes sp. DH11]
MRLRSLFRRLARPAVAGGLAVVAGMAVTGLALPAQAAEDGDIPFVTFTGPETVTVVSGQSKTVKFSLYNTGTVPAEDVVLRFGDKAHPVGTALGFTPPAGCVRNACELGDFKPGERRTLRFTVKPAAAAGPVGSIPVTTTVGGLPSFESSVAVVQTDKGGADLEVGDIKSLKLGRGRSADVPFEVRNTGDKAVEAVGLVVFPLHDGVAAELDYRNCAAVQDEELGGVLCVFEDPLAAGGTFVLPESTPLRVRVKADAPGPYDYPVFVTAVGITGEFLGEFDRRTAGATGAELKLEARLTATDEEDEEPAGIDDLNPEDNFAEFAVSVPRSAADSRAIGGVFAGQPGDTVEAEAGVQNLGPTATVPIGFNWFPFVHVKMPTGVRLVRIDSACMPGTSPADVDYEDESLNGRDYVCAVDTLAKNQKVLFTFTAEILDGRHAAGAVTVDGGVQDTKRGNDRAALTVDMPSAGQGGGEGLPITGAPAGLLAGGGAVLLVVGLIAYRAARRRRTITLVE